jgi:hypothetical protein
MRYSFGYRHQFGLFTPNYAAVLASKTPLPHHAPRPRRHPRPHRRLLLAAPRPLVRPPPPPPQGSLQPFLKRFSTNSAPQSLPAGQPEPKTNALSAKQLNPARNTRCHRRSRPFYTPWIPRPCENRTTAGSEARSKRSFQHRPRRRGFSQKNGRLSANVEGLPGDRRCHPR